MPKGPSSSPHAILVDHIPLSVELADATAKVCIQALLDEGYAIVEIGPLNAGMAQLADVLRAMLSRHGIEVPKPERADTKAEAHA